MNPALEQIASRLDGARTAEEVFGEIAGEAGLTKVYHQLARAAHPDAYTNAEDRVLAQQTFARLGEWLALAREKVRVGAYGTGRGQAGISLRSPKRAYTVDTTFTADDLYNRYPCRFEENGQVIAAELRLARDPRNNDLAHNEARILSLLRPEDRKEKFSAYFPHLLDSFLIADDGMQHQANIIECEPGWYTLAQVHEEYPDGIDPKDMAWIWRRLLVALGTAHAKGIIHGAVLPGNVSILPGEHGLRLDQWTFSALPEEGGTITGIEAAYYAWYPDEILNKEIPTPGTDIFLAARCMNFLLGGDPTQKKPAHAPKPIQAFLKGCTLTSARSRPQDAWALKEEFDELLQQLWGKRTFHPFFMKAQPKHP